jgi:hypothetical protein
MIPATTKVDDGSEAQPKKPYATPALKRLGSVRDLTLGKSTGQADGKGNAAMGM